MNKVFEYTVIKRTIRIITKVIKEIIRYLYIALVVALLSIKEEIIMNFIEMLFGIASDLEFNLMKIRRITSLITVLAVTTSFNAI